MSKVRRWIAYRLIRLAVQVDTETTVRMSQTLVAANAKRILDSMGLVLVQAHDEDGHPFIRPVYADPDTLH